MLLVLQVGTERVLCCSLHPNPWNSDTRLLCNAAHAVSRYRGLV